MTNNLTNKEIINLCYVKYFCKKCKKNHYLLFTKNNYFFIELEGKPKNNTGKLCKINTKGFVFEGVQKYRFNCNEAIYLNFEKGIFKGFKIGKYFTEICKDINVIEE